MARRTRRLFDPYSDKPFALSRTKVDLFRECPRCFYLDRRLGIGRPKGFPFNLNSAVDELLKKEFDGYREQQTPHPLMTDNSVAAVPYQHDELDKWRANFTGVRVQHDASGFEVFGAVDDIWQENATGDLIVVDYKATSKNGEVNIDAPWQISYKRQMEFYQWLLRQRGFQVSNRGYFVYCNGDKSKPGFDGKLEFSIKVIPYDGQDDWIESTLVDAKNVLSADQAPPPGDECEYCDYIREAGLT